MSDIAKQFFDGPVAHDSSRQLNGNVTNSKSNDTHNANAVNIMNVITSNWKTTISAIFLGIAILCVVIASATGVIHSRSGATIPSL